MSDEDMAVVTVLYESSGRLVDFAGPDGTYDVVISREGVWEVNDDVADELRVRKNIRNSFKGEYNYGEIEDELEIERDDPDLIAIVKDFGEIKTNMKIEKVPQCMRHVVSEEDGDEVLYLTRRLS